MWICSGGHVNQLLRIPGAGNDRVCRRAASLVRNSCILGDPGEQLFKSAVREGRCSDDSIRGALGPVGGVGFMNYRDRIEGEMAKMGWGAVDQTFFIMHRSLRLTPLESTDFI